MGNVLYQTIQRLARELQLDVADLVGSSRKHDLVEARYIVAYVLCRRFERLTLDEIGAVLGGRHRSTVNYGLRVIAERAAADAEFRALLAELVVTSKQQQEQEQPSVCEKVGQAAAPHAAAHRLLRTLLVGPYVMVCRPPAA